MEIKKELINKIIDRDFNNNPDEIINKKPEGDILLPPKQPQITPTPENN